MELIDKLEKSIDALATELQALRAENNILRNQNANPLSAPTQNSGQEQSLSIDENVRSEALSRVDNLLSIVRERLAQKGVSL